MSVPRSVPLTEIIGKNGLICDGDWIESKDQDPSGDVRLIQLMDIGVGEYLNKSKRYLTSANAAALKCTFLEENDLLLARMPDPVGRTCIFPGDAMPCVTAVDVCIIRPDREVADFRWLNHYLNSAPFSREIDRFVKGTTRQRISRSNLGRIKIPLPTLAEQRRIAAILDKAEALRANRRDAVSRVECFIKALFDSLFGDPLKNNMKWQVTLLKDACSEINDCPHSTPQWTSEGVVCLRTSNLSAGGWDWTDKRFVSEATYRERSSRGHLESGDIVLSREGTVGIAAIVPNDLRACMGQRLVQVKTSPRLLTPEFTLRFLLHVLAPERIGKSMVGSTSQHLNVKELRSLKMPIPPLELQHQFASAMKAAVHLHSRCETSVSSLDVLFASLQHRAFRGEL